MQYRKYSFLVGALLLTSLTANAQRGVGIGVGQTQWREVPSNQARNAQTPARSYTSVDAYGNVTRTTAQTPGTNSTSVAGMIANQAVRGATATSNTTLGFSNSYGNSYSNSYGNISNGYCPPGYYQPGYYPPAYPSAYPYPYPGVSNNYYYPATPYTIPISPRRYDWEHQATITVAPIGGYAGGYAAPAYPYPYPAYPMPYPYANAYPYQGYPYPYAGNTTTIISGTNNAGITTQFRSSGYGLSVGRGGVTGQISNRNTTSSTVVTTR
jgi:hypothetical protein